MRYKRGEKKDRAVFWAYQADGRERWVDPSRFSFLIHKEKERNKSLKLPEFKNLKRGDKRDDGKVFWAYAKGCKGGESWLPVDKFHQKMINNRIIDKKRNPARYGDPVFSMKMRIRRGINDALQCFKASKRPPSEIIIGCSWSKLKRHIENQFKSGMTWENRNLWHVDHIVPLYCATTEEGVVKLNHYSNLRPVWAKENLTKGHRLQLAP